jgi:hypothetical protein
MCDDSEFEGEGEDKPMQAKGPGPGILRCSMLGLLAEVGRVTVNSGNSGI